MEYTGKSSLTDAAFVAPVWRMVKTLCELSLGGNYHSQILEHYQRILLFKQSNAWLLSFPGFTRDYSFPLLSRWRHLLWTLDWFFYWLINAWVLQPISTKNTATDWELVFAEVSKYLLRVTLRHPMQDLTSLQKLTRVLSPLLQKLTRALSLMLSLVDSNHESEFLRAISASE